MPITPIYEDCPAITAEKNIYVSIRESFSSNMRYFHMHSHYEISLILSGDVTVLLPQLMHSGTEPRIVLLRPFTQHYMIPQESVLYKRINISFTEEFVSAMPGEWYPFQKLFAPNGCILLPNTEQCRRLEQIATVLENEDNPMRCRLLLMVYLSLLSETHVAQETETKETPEYIVKALSYIGEHYAEKITGIALAKQIGIGRTTLMTGFHKYTGVSMHGYQQNLRLKKADMMRNQGYSVAEAASACGYCDIGGYIRAYRRANGMTPTGRK